MNLGERARKAAMGAAGVAVATSGLSTCNNGGAVDPPPPPLQCNAVSAGQTLSASATRSGDVIDVTIANVGTSGWEVFRVTELTGATIAAITLPTSGSLEVLRMSLQLATPTTTAVSFRLEGRLFGYATETCDVTRTFMLGIQGGTITITLEPSDLLPLAARQIAEIVPVEQDGRLVTLAARTPYWGLYEAKWSVLGGVLDRQEGSPVRWTLPEEPGVYQIELLLDYGPDGLALDVLRLEVGEPEARSS